MRGVAVDMEAMRAANEQSIAMGNGRMNARGDIIGQGGKIEIRREQIAREYFSNNPGASKQVSLKPAMPDSFETPQEAMARLQAAVDELDASKELAPRRGRKLINKGEE